MKVFITKQVGIKEVKKSFERQVDKEEVKSDETRPTNRQEAAGTSSHHSFPLIPSFSSHFI